MSWIQTYTGKKFYPLDPRVDDICIEDIAHALSQICRFTGHCREFYSVGQHSILVSKHVAPENALWGLLHDASEAYICDLSHPVKMTDAMHNYRVIEDNLMNFVCMKFGLPMEMPDDVKHFDTVLLFTEKRDLTTPSEHAWRPGPDPLEERITPMPPKEVEAAFLARFKELYCT